MSKVCNLIIQNKIKQGIIQYGEKKESWPEEIATCYVKWEYPIMLK